MDESLEDQLDREMKKAKELEKQRKLPIREAEAIHIAKAIADALMEQKATERVLTLINVTESMRITGLQLESLTKEFSERMHNQEDAMNDFQGQINAVVGNMKSLVNLLDGMNERDKVAKQKENEVLDNLNKYLKNWL